jgi:hypothetical protein
VFHDPLPLALKQSLFCWVSNRRWENKMGDVYLSDSAVISLVDALAEEVIKYGEEEAKLIGSNKLNEEETSILMKTNTLLTAFAMFILNVVNSKDVPVARQLLKVWTSSTMQDLIQYAFTEEILTANSNIEKEIDELERFINEEGNK